MSMLGRGFRYTPKIITPEGRVIHRPQVSNLVPKEGVAHVAGLILGTAVPISNWYAFLFSGNYLPDENSKAADLPGIISECTTYASSTRPAWQGQFDGSNLLVNPVDVEFVMTADKVIYGAGIVSSSVKGGNGGLILSIARFPSPESLKSGAKFTLTADLPLLSTDV